MTQPATYAVIRSVGQSASQLPIPEQKAAEPAGKNSGAVFIEASVALLGELENSLQASQRDLLARNLAGIEQHTGKQIGLLHAFEILWSQDSLGASEPRPFDRLFDLAGATELGAAQRRVLHLGRVQAALLTRAQRRSRMLFHLSAGPGAAYTAPAVERAGLDPAWPPARGGGAMAGHETHSKENPRSESSYPQKAEESANRKNLEERPPCRA